MKHDKVRDLKTCPVCGKVFILESMDWTYKTTKYFAKKRNETKYFCSWHCMRKDETTVPTDSKKNKGGAPKQLNSKKVIGDYISGTSITEIAKKYGVTNSGISSLLRRHDVIR